MSVDGFWWFYKIHSEKFEAVQSEFEQAARGVPQLPRVPALLRRPHATPGNTLEYAASILDGVSMGNDLGLELSHKPFESMAYRIIHYQASKLNSFASRKEDSFYRRDYRIPEVEKSLIIETEDWVECVMQNRVLPTVILLVGIGDERFSRLPGYLGNMLIRPKDIAQTIESVAHILEVDLERYSARAKRVLAYGGDDERAAKGVMQALKAIPNALARTKDENAGLLAITSWGCP